MIHQFFSHSLLFVWAETETIKAWQFSCIEMLIRMAETEGGEIDCWNSNRIYRRSQAPVHLCALLVWLSQLVTRVEGVDVAPILHKLPRGYPSCQLWLLCFVCLVPSRMRLLYVWYYNRYVILLPTQIITGFRRFFYTKEEEDYTTTEFYHI